MSRTFLSESPYFQNNKSERFSRLRTLRSRKKRLMGWIFTNPEIQTSHVRFRCPGARNDKSNEFCKRKIGLNITTTFFGEKKTLRACHSELFIIRSGVANNRNAKKLLHDAGFALLCLQRPWQDFWALDYSWLQLFSQDWITGLFFSKPFRMKQKPVWSETATFNFNLL